MSYFCSHVTVFQLSFVVYSFYILVLYVHLHLVHLHISHISLHLVTSSLFSSFQSYHRVRCSNIFSFSQFSTFLIWSLISCSCANYIYVRFLKFISFWNRGVTVSGQIMGPIMNKFLRVHSPRARERKRKAANAESSGPGVSEAFTFFPRVRERKN